MNTYGINIVDGLRQLYCDKINRVGSFNKASAGVRQWLFQDTIVFPQSINGTDAIEIITYDLDKPLTSVAYDIQRLSCASLETMSSLKPSENNDKFLAWQLIQMYYAAFYAAHSILKICGMGLTQIDDKAVNNLKKNGRTRGIVIPSLCTGIYCVDINRNNRWMTIYKGKKYDDSHRGLWARFIDFLGVVNGSIVRTDDYNNACIRLQQLGDCKSDSIWDQFSSADAFIVYNRIESFADLLKQNGRNWLSNIRNNVNYSHQYGVWFPYQNILKDYKRVVSSNKLYMEDPLSDVFVLDNKSEIIKYVLACHFIVSLNREMLIDLSLRHPNSRSFLKNNVIKYLNQYCISN